ncbi:hypothetical protein LJC42_01625 [Eubacteriales bacterium OttesenSCG-928-K08]|nr:hypothetical protein [Eubacteriales bacterium OttesenSCG-928-K08]
MKKWVFHFQTLKAARSRASGIEWSAQESGARLRDAIIACACGMGAVLLILTILLLRERNGAQELEPPPLTVFPSASPTQLLPPTLTIAPLPTPVATPTPSPSPTPSAKPTATPTAKPTPTPEQTPDETQTPEPGEETPDPEETDEGGLWVPQNTPEPIGDWWNLWA